MHDCAIAVTEQVRTEAMLWNCFLGGYPSIHAQFQFACDFVIITYRLIEHQVTSTVE